MPQIHAALAVTYSKLSRGHDAEREIEFLVQASPMFTCSYLRETLPYRDQEVLNEQLAALSAAGLPEQRSGS